MTQDQWSAVDRYIEEHLVGDDPALERALRSGADAGMPPINVAPAQGKFLNLLATLHGARTVLEIGTLAGYSTIWLARALPEDGRVVTLESNPAYAELARSNITHAGLGGLVDVRVGSALDTLPVLADEGAGPFDFVFIDADKVNNPKYVDWALRLTRRGSVIVVDNVVRSGAVIDATNGDDRIAGVRRMFEQLSTEPRLSASALQTVGAKGHDGFLVAVVTADV